MPVCFSLYDKETGKHAILSQVDDRLRLALNQPPDEKNYLARWYDVLGLRFALGWTPTKIRQDWEAADVNYGQPLSETDLLLSKILDLIESWYEIDNWREMK